MSRFYSKKELRLRIIWGVVYPIFFKLSPRLCYGWRNMILRLMGAKIGRNVRIFPSAVITFPWLLEVENDVVISWDVRVYNLGFTKIGEQSVISQHAHLCGGTHDFEKSGFVLLRTGLIIGRRVWIAADAFVGPGVNVGDDSVVAARAVVVKNVEPNTLVGGNPARIIRTIRGAFAKNHT